MKNNRTRPIVKKGDRPTLVENLGYLNSVYCPKCGKHLFSYYDKEIIPDRNDGYIFRIWHKWNYCSECGLFLNLDAWKDLNDTAEDINNLFYKPLPTTKNNNIIFDD